MTNNIFETFKRVRDYRTSEPGKSGEEVFFRIVPDAQGRAMLKVTDRKGNGVNADYRHYSGDTFLLLRTIASIRDSMAANLSWGTGGGGVYLDEQPLLMGRLLRCGRLADAKGRPLNAVDGQYQVQADIQDDGRNFAASFSLIKN